MNYENMSDFEVNKAVAHKRFEGNSLFIDGYESGMLKISDYCNSPSDAWPIIVGNKISLIEEGNRWSAYSGFEALENMEGGGCDFTHGWTDKNPLRAAMIVYIMMQESN